MTEIPPPIPVEEPVKPVVVGTPTAQSPTGFATAVFVLGLCGLIPLLGILCGLIAVILGIVALARPCGCARKGLAIAGIVVGAVAVIVQPIAMAVMVPAVQRAVELANQASCRANLKGISTAVAMYRGENRDARYPKDIETLIEEGLVTIDAFDCPSAQRLGRQRSRFHFFPKRSGDARGSTFMICDLKGNHPDGRAVAHVSGQVVFLHEEEFQSLLTRPENADFARAMKDAGVE